VTLWWPGTLLDRVWEVNPEGQAGLLAAGRLAAAAILAVNTFGDLTSAVVRRDPRALIGVPIAAALVWWLWRPRVRASFH
jgi:hypothetical protein